MIRAHATAPQALTDAPRLTVQRTALAEALADAALLVGWGMLWSLFALALTG